MIGNSPRTRIKVRQANERKECLVLAILMILMMLVALVYS